VATVQPNVSIEVGLVKSEKLTWHIWSRNLMMYVVFFILFISLLQQQ